MQNLQLNYFVKFRNYFFISLILLGVSHALHLHPLVGVAFGIAPLFSYHIFYLAPKAKKNELTQPAIDSVYYFGFLITVASLGLSAISIANSGDETDFNNVIFQFGVGLIATGYAVIARMHLISIRAQADAHNTEEAMESFIKKSMTLTQAVDEYKPSQTLDDPAYHEALCWKSPTPSWPLNLVQILGRATNP